MRFTTGLLTATLASLATASSSATVQTYNYYFPSSNPLAVSPSTARLGLASLAGVTKFYDLDETPDARQLELIEQLSSGLFEDTSSQLIVSLTGGGKLENGEHLPRGVWT